MLLYKYNKPVYDYIVLVKTFAQNSMGGYGPEEISCPIINGDVAEKYIKTHLKLIEFDKLSLESCRLRLVEEFKGSTREYAEMRESMENCMIEFARGFGKDKGDISNENAPKSWSEFIGRYF